MGVTQEQLPASRYAPVNGLVSRPLDLRELRYFHSVALTGNFGRAARELKLSQPAISHQVTKLEEGIGTPLFIRHGRGVTLTPAGSTLLDRVDQIMRLLNAPLREAPVPGRTVGTISLGLPAECAPLLVPPLITKCRERWPHVTVSVYEADSASLEEWVLSGRVDVAILQDPGAIGPLRTDPVVREQLGLVAAADGIFGETNTSVRPRDLIGKQIILPRARHWIRRRVETAWFRRGISLDRIHEADSVSVIKGMIRGKLGYSILPPAAVKDELARGNLIFRPVEQMPLFGVHAIVRASDTEERALAPVLSKILRETMVEMVDLGSWTGASAVDSGTDEYRTELDVC